jgi:hypothetical protein
LTVVVIALHLCSVLRIQPQAMKSRTALRGRQNAQQKSETGGHPPLSSLLPFTFDASSSNGKISFHPKSFARDFRLGPPRPCGKL